MNVKLKKCKVCESYFKPFKTTDKVCSYDCASKIKKKQPRKPKQRIKPISDKRKKEIAVYQKKRIEFLEKPENKICFIEGCEKPSTTIEHRAGRIGSNYLDESKWAGCCFEHNLELERNPELSKKYQLSKIHGGAKM